MVKTKELDMWEGYYTSYKHRQDKKIRVAFYARVSTEHEAQVNALKNQQSWCIDLLRMHPNWEMTEMYTDRGITGTQAKRRNGFLNAIEDGKNKCFDLLVVRDVSRFARNCEESLKYTHLLKRHGVEVYFHNDGIWSMDADGDLRLGLMSILAQDESRRISEKVLAGQHISRQKGVLYGTGNILGYRLVKGRTSVDNTYEIIEEDAETVRMVFDLYVNKGMGIKKISSTLIAEHRRNASGEIKWDAGKVSRILNNRTYAGYIGYRKSQCVNFLEHTRVKTDLSEHIYEKGNFPEIISDETWQKAQQIKKRNTLIVNDRIRTGKKPAKDKWVKVLRCECGASYKRYKWRVNQGTQEEVYGYQCSNQVQHRKRSYIVKQGLDGNGYCDVPSIPQWHLDYQFKRILELIWKNPKETVENLIESIKGNYVEDQSCDADAGMERLERERDRLKLRLKNLMDMRLDGELDKDSYADKKAELTERLARLKAEIHKVSGENGKSVKENGDRKTALAEIRKVLEETSDIDVKFIDADLVKQTVRRVTPYEDGTYKWYLDLVAEECEKEFSEDDYVSCCVFDITFEEAKAYRKQFGNYIRMRQWRDIHVQVFIKV